MNVLVTGGAGYIGSHAVKRLRQQGHSVIALDNLSRGHRQAVPAEVPFCEVDLRSTDEVTAVLEKHQVECVMHFAALAYVGESVQEPLRYHDNNTGGTTSLLLACQRASVEKLVFSSTCATYGEPERMPIVESMPQNPINPYGWSKLASERVLKDYRASRPEFSFAALRYFNVAGSDRDGELGEHHEPETHLIPVILQVALGQREKLQIYGDDYPTPDGTCIRDYIHVEDLIDAHILAMKALAPGKELIYNLGIGRGHSVREILSAAEQVLGRKLPVEVGPRRPGDPPELYSDPSKIERELGFKAQITDIAETIESAWRWFRAHPNGYS